MGDHPIDVTSSLKPRVKSQQIWPVSVVRSWSRSQVCNCVVFSQPREDQSESRAIADGIYLDPCILADKISTKKKIIGPAL